MKSQDESLLCIRVSVDGDYDLVKVSDIFKNRGTSIITFDDKYIMYSQHPSPSEAINIESNGFQWNQSINEIYARKTFPFYGDVYLARCDEDGCTKETMYRVREFIQNRKKQIKEYIESKKSFCRRIIDYVLCT
jgi:hypothetical protein